MSRKQKVKQSFELAKPDLIPLEPWMISVEKYIDAWCEVNGYTRVSDLEFMADPVSKQKYDSLFVNSMPYLVICHLETG